MKKLAGITAALLSIGTLVWFHSLAMNQLHQANWKDNNRTGSHPERVSEITNAVSVVGPQVTQQMADTLRINGHYVRTTASWRIME